MILSSDLLDYIRHLGIQIRRHPEQYNPPERARELVCAALEGYRDKYIGPERREEFYTIAMAAFEDGEEEGARQVM
ncbi:MAG TPA: hypothetical protein VMD25_05235 [Acidobacteriaceae bacterium]|nr:hypothetical protein [Acidobacteriaceae bacterium]